jgi:hypothetical protein
MGVNPGCVHAAEMTPCMSISERRVRFRAGNPQFPQGVEWVDGLISRHRALADAFAKLYPATGPAVIKKVITVLALVQFLEPDIPPASLALLFDLLPPLAVKLHGHITRGSIAAGVAVLRCTNMGNSQMEQWLDVAARNHNRPDAQSRGVSGAD